MAPPTNSRTGTCESCGRGNEVIVALRRVYLSVGDGGSEEDVEIVTEIEHWCDVCRDHYPHQLI